MPSPHAGRTTRRFKLLARKLRAARRPCWLCGQPIDYSLPRDDPQAFTVDHALPRSTHPHLAEEPTNLRAAHARCNKSRGTTDPKPGIGSTSRDW
jgi:5-methylcytosine-specific restriction endonuclease McrA